VLLGSVGCAKCSSVGINLVPSYGSAYLRDGAAEKARAARNVDLGSASRKQSRLALWPASRVMKAAIVISRTGRVETSPAAIEFMSPKGFHQQLAFCLRLRRRLGGSTIL